MIGPISSGEFALVRYGDNHTGKVSPVSRRASEGEYLPPKHITRQEKNHEEINCTVVARNVEDSLGIKGSDKLLFSSLSDVRAIYGALNNFTAKENLKGKLISILA